MASRRLARPFLAVVLATGVSWFPAAWAEDRDSITNWKKAKPTQQVEKRKKQPDAANSAEEATPRSVSNLTNSQKLSKAVTETEIVAGRDERPMLSQGSAADMQDAIARYEAIAARGGWPAVKIAAFKIGVESKAAVPLKRRLAVEGFYSAQHADNPLVTENMVQALRQFQMNYGLEASGRLDKATVAALNVPVGRRIAALRANLTRLDEYAKELAGRYILVNIPALQLEAVNGNSVFSRHNIIAGKPDRPSPVVMTHLSDINFNPYWNAPVSIVEKDIIPEVQRKGTGVLKQIGIRVFDGYNGPEVDPNDVDWDNLEANRYFFRQDPGEDNAMAAVKINFPSPFGVYMHDTPTRSLFTSGARYLSSGCVRVDKVQILVDWILNGQDGWNASRIADLAASGERQDVKLVDPPQIRWVYLTAWVASNGQVNFRKDIYDLDGTGFVMGQPTPVGEYAEDGQRYFLKAPVKRAAVEPADDVSPLLKKAALVPEAKPEAPAKNSFGKVLETKPRVSGSLERTGKPTKAAALVADEKPAARKTGNFNKAPEPVKKKAKATKPADAKVKQAAGKPKPAESKAKPAEAKSKAIATKAKPADVKAKPKVAKATQDPAKKPAVKTVPATGAAKKKKKPSQTTTAASGGPVFGAQ